MVLEQFQQISIKPTFIFTICDSFKKLMKKLHAALKTGQFERISSNLNLKKKKKNYP
jgi:hypothetical protein